MEEGSPCCHGNGELARMTRRECDKQRPTKHKPEYRQMCTENDEEGNEDETFSTLAGDSGSDFSSLRWSGLSGGSSWGNARREQSEPRSDRSKFCFEGLCERSDVYSRA